MFNPNDAEKTEIQKTIHTAGWMLIQKLYEDRRQTIHDDLESTSPMTQDINYSRGKASAFKEAQTLPWTTANKESKEEG